ncbi:class D sortase [Aquibacillus sp. 3ASR75-11]|uniref:Class D sortase n=1 Tax=Terrihalobacillus insolitus TaxID=2950438 RepID=A0A9X3WRA1_9BACI|nr:class D sortase [Terrihalobacillus insolitus]MDC3413626.1 class D sortase [Terrihalobacillus insolitus]MDC3424617.1 class D sortase [Terrihalobacillus insolitus]
MRIIAVTLVLLGLTTMMYPFLNRAYSSFQEMKLLEQWQLISLSQDALEEETVKTRSLGLEQIPADQERKFVSADSKEFATNDELIGTLSITKIDLEIPILNGANLDNLKVAAGRLEGTQPLDVATGNTGIAAHRSYTYGKQFNRLNELEAGDKIVINTQKRTYTFTVYDTFIVEPTDVSVLKRKEKERTITLITCEPMKNPTKRLIVQARL